MRSMLLSGMCWRITVWQSPQKILLMNSLDIYNTHNRKKRGLCFLVNDVDDFSEVWRYTMQFIHIFCRQFRYNIHVFHPIMDIHTLINIVSPKKRRGVDYTTKFRLNRMLIRLLMVSVSLTSFLKSPCTSYSLESSTYPMRLLLLSNK